MQAIILGSLLGASFCLTALALCTGLSLGGAWRELPRGLSWEVVQLMEMAPTLLHAAILTHWSRLLACTPSTAVLALLYILGFAASVVSVLDPTHALALQLTIIAHQVSQGGAPFAPPALVARDGERAMRGRAVDPPVDPPVLPLASEVKTSVSLPPSSQCAVVAYDSMTTPGGSTPPSAARCASWSLPSPSSSSPCLPPLFQSSPVCGGGLQRHDDPRLVRRKARRLPAMA